MSALFDDERVIDDGFAVPIKAAHKPSKPLRRKFTSMAEIAEAFPNANSKKRAAAIAALLAGDDEEQQQQLDGEEQSAGGGGDSVEAPAKKSRKGAGDGNKKKKGNPKKNDADRAETRALDPSVPPPKPFEFDNDARAGDVDKKPQAISPGSLTDKVTNYGTRMLMTRTFGFATNVDDYGEAALSGPFALSFLSDPHVADAYARAYKEFMERDPRGHANEWALEEFQRTGGYAAAKAQLERAFGEQGLRIQFPYHMPVPTIGPKYASGDSDKLVERLGPLRFRVDCPQGTTKRTKKRKDLTVIADPSFSTSRTNLRGPRREMLRANLGAVQNGGRPIPAAAATTRTTMAAQLESAEEPGVQEEQDDGYQARVAQEADATAAAVAAEEDLFGGSDNLLDELLSAVPPRPLIEVVRGDQTDTHTFPCVSCVSQTVDQTLEVAFMNLTFVCV